jgi:hypothetical protein
MGSVKSHVARLAVGLVALAFAAPAFAADPSPPVPPSTPSISQYVETVPTSEGGASAGSGKRNANALPPGVAKKLSAHPDALTKRLEAIATSSAYGAPQQGLSRPSEPNAQNPVSAAVSAATDSSDSHIFWLLGAVIVVTTAMVWATARRHRA